MHPLIEPILFRSRAVLLALAFAALGAGSAWAQTGADAIIVSPPSGATFDVGEQVSFQGGGTDPDGGSIVGFAWTFEGGDPSASNEQNPSGVTFATAGQKTISLTVTDDSSETADEVITINIEEPAQDPTVTITAPANNATFAPNENVDFTATGSDPDGGSVTFSWSFQGGSPSTGTGSSPNDIQFAAPGPHNVTVTVTDDENDTAQNQITIQISSQAPIANIDSPANGANFGSGVQIDFSASGSDPDGGAPVSFAWTFQGGNPSTSNVRQPQNVTFAAPGPHTITLTVTDDENDTAQDQITIQIDDSPPLANISNPANNSQFSPGQQIDFTGTGSDPDGGTVSFSWAFQGGSPPTSTQQNPANVTFAAPGPHTVTLTVRDNENSTTQDQITIQIQNQLPNGTITAPSNNTVVEPGAQVDFAGSGTDPDGGSVTFAWTFQGGTPGSSTSQNPQNVTFSGGGSHLVTLTVTDNEGSPDPTPATVNIITNQPPNAVNDNATTQEDEAVTTNVLANDSDPNGDPIEVTDCHTPTNGTVTESGDDSCRFTPTPNFSGTATYQYTISDGSQTDVATVTVNVQDVNDPPTAAPVSETTAEDTPVTTQVRASAVDPDDLNTDLDLTCSNPINGSVSKVGNNACRFSPDPNFNGAARYTYSVEDPDGATASATVTVTVTPVNDPPVATNDNASTLEDVPVTTNVVQNDTDPDGTPTVQSCQDASVGSVVRFNATSCRYTPPTDFTGSATYTYTITDGQGGSDQGQVTINVGSTQDPPVAVNDAASTPEDTPVTVNVRANDSDADGDPLTVISVTQPPAGGTASVGGGGQNVVFTPAPNFNGSVNFTYTVSDGQGGTGSANVAVTITPVNDPPDALDDVASTPEDVPVTVNVLGNDVDPDGNALTITGVSSPTNGTAQVVSAGTLVRFTPASGFNGTAGVSYTISDGQGGTDTARLTVSVGAVQDAPTAVEDAATTAEDVAVTINVLANDVDPDNDPLDVASVGPAANGTATVVNNGDAVQYTPNLNFNGTDTFTYTATDGAGSSSATVTVTVTPLPDPPIANDDAAATPEQTAVTIGVMANDNDPDGDPISVTGVTSPANGTAAVNENGAVTYTPNAGFQGTDTFTYTLSDGQGGTDTATVTVSIEAVEVGAMNVEVEAPGSAGRVDGHDVLFILRAIPTQDLRADVNRDGIVDQTDVQLAVGAMGASQ